MTEREKEKERERGRERSGLLRKRLAMKERISEENPLNEVAPAILSISPLIFYFFLLLLLSLLKRMLF